MVLKEFIRSHLLLVLGFEPYFRLGTSWGQLGGGLPPAGIPYNKSALIDVMVHTVSRVTRF